VAVARDGRLVAAAYGRAGAARVGTQLRARRLVVRAGGLPG